MRETIKMSRAEYLALRHQNEKDEIQKEIQNKLISGEITTQKEIDKIYFQDLRYNNEKVIEIGKKYPILKHTQGESSTIAGTEIPCIIISVELVEIT